MFLRNENFQLFKVLVCLLIFAGLVLAERKDFLKVGLLSIFLKAPCKISNSAGNFIRDLFWIFCNFHSFLCKNNF